ncbi:diguanylate cyclase domain-containing protein [Geotalea uraniireducens]|uniref:diguanylate cyclase domain-containing protein n=1 Tax=Geotalea uraniireducens TaxID=351604 RepID=UPI00006B6CA8|nr:diguanylate cyclase [Geotalea uraniireducens]
MEEQKGLRFDKQTRFYLNTSGVAESSDSLRSADEVLRAADKALYRAKSKGRNQLSK